MSKILVIIPHFNKLILLKECLFHLNKQNVENFEVMIVDNGSTDGSSEYIFNLCSKEKKYHNILLNENMGFAYAVNLGIKYSIENGFDYSILLNNDAYIEDDFIYELSKKISKSKKYFAVSSLMISYHNKNIVDSFGDNYTLLGYAFQNKLNESIDDIDRDELTFSACGGASIYNNEVLKKIGLFDENFFAYLEDVDISYRAKLHGYKISTCKAAKCYHLGSATSGSKYNEFKVRISARNNIYVIYKNMPFIQVMINIFPLFLGLILKQIYFISRGFGLDYFFGIFDAIKNINNIKKNDFKKFDIYTYVMIEIELIINSFKYLFNFIKRHI